MKTPLELDRLFNQLYWHMEHGEIAVGIQKLNLMQSAAFLEGEESGIKKAAAIVHDEPNLPGDMPMTFFRDQLGTIEKATITMRSTVAVTMDNIKSRILKAAKQL